jgi:hypothetical protein
MRKHRAAAIVALAALVTLPLAFPSQAQDKTPYRITGPFAHGNLAIYLVHGESAPGPTPLTLEEALNQGAVVVKETGSVNQLTIENRGGQAVFVQSGDIVKGGRQDRALTASLVLPPHSGEVDIAAYCVEHGRWTGRGSEASDHFASSNEALPSRQAKLALATPDAGYGARQGEVWNTVAEVQKKLETNVGAPVAAAASPTSLELSIETGTVAKAREDYVAALADAGRKDRDVIGEVAVINGKISNADLYPSNALFRKMWDKNLRASAVEALSEREGGGAAGSAAAAPAPAEVDAFLVSVDEGKADAKPIVAGNALETRETPAALGVKTERDGQWVHKSYLARMTDDESSVEHDEPNVRQQSVPNPAQQSIPNPPVHP